jgi:amidase
LNDAATLCQAPTVEIATAIRGGRISARTMLDVFLARIEQHNPAINAVVAMDIAGARKRADEADAALARGESWGPLHGVPFTLKDTLDVVGLPTVCGSPSLKTYVPKANAVVAQRLLDAGAIIFGKTNVPLFAQDLQTYNKVYGTTRNPWNTSRTSGGSSGGPAAALAAGLTGGELGSDIGGSIRTPAHFCGVYGHKPSLGLVPMRGHIPGPPGTLAEADLAVIGPMGRSAADLDLLLDVIAGPEPDEGRAWSLSLPACDQTLQDFRVLAWLDDPSCPVDRDVAAPLHDTVARLRAAGVSVADGPVDGFELREVYALYMQMLAAVMGGGLPEKMYKRFGWLAGTARLLRRTRPDSVGGYAIGATQSHRDWLRADEKRARLRRKWEGLFERYDLILMPVVPTTAIAHLHEGNLFSRKLTVNGEPRPYSELFPWISLAALLYLPATVAPVGLANGLPVGMQIIAPYLHDRRSIRFAQLLASVQPPPTLPKTPGLR